MICKECKGKGEYMTTSEYDNREWIEIICNYCNGKGKI